MHNQTFVRIMNTFVGTLNMTDAFICDGVRTPFGRYGGALSGVRADDLAAVPIKALIKKYAQIDWSAVDDVFCGCANQAGEDNRDVARMALLLAGLPDSVPGVTVNRLCGSGLEALAQASRAIRSREASFVLAAGVESMSRAPFVVSKADGAFSRAVRFEDSTLGWRFVNPVMKALYGTDPLAETAENVAAEYGVGRDEQDRFAFRSQEKAENARKAGYLAEEIVPVVIPVKKGPDRVVDVDEHPRPDTTLDALARLKPVTRPDGTVTAGNASGINDGAAALIVASPEAAERHGLTPRARIVGTAVAGVPPRIMGMGPVPATRKVMAMTGLTVSQMDVIEINEAFAAQAIAVSRELGLPDDCPSVNPNGGAIALGHPLGASGSRLVLAAVHQLERTGGRYALCSMCIGVGQGIAVILERVQNSWKPAEKLETR
jgi:3-oxoadipyl-CoA thiolase